VRPQHTSRTRADSIQIGTERPPRVSLDCLDLGGLGSVYTLSVTCSARIRRTPLHFDTGDDADTCPPLATTKCGQQRRGQRRPDLRKEAHSVSRITLPVDNALARWQLTTRRATRSGFISPFQTVGPTLVGMLLRFCLEHACLNFDWAPDPNAPARVAPVPSNHLGVWRRGGQTHPGGAYAVNGDRGGYHRLRSPHRDRSRSASPPRAIWDT